MGGKRSMQATTCSNKNLWGDYTYFQKVLTYPFEGYTYFGLDRQVSWVVRAILATSYHCCVGRHTNSRGR